MSKSKWDDVKNKLFLVECWARDGLIDKQIAKNLGISVASLNSYKLQHLEFLAALKKGKEVIDFEVENALLKRALGFEYEEVQISKENDCGDIKSKVVKTTKIVVPDVTAQIYWLKNRKPDKWRDKPAGDSGDSIDNANKQVFVVSDLVLNPHNNRRAEDFDDD